MIDYSRVSRKELRDDRIAICPVFGCESMTRVKPLKFRFLGFGKYPKCKKHHIPLVYLDERIGESVDGALACLFDKSGLPLSELISMLASKHADELQSFIQGWVYCITTGRGAPIVSRYLDSIAKTYMKKLKRKQIKVLKNKGSSKNASQYQALRKGRKELGMQYARFLKYLRIHSEVLVNAKNLKPLSNNLKHDLKKWQEGSIHSYLKTKSLVNEEKMTLTEIKGKYDLILNIGTCRCLIGMSSEIKKVKITAFDRFSAYMEFHSEGITEKFTKSDLKKLEETKEINRYIHKEDMVLDEDELNRNPSIPTVLKEEVIKFILVYLKPFSIHNLEESKILELRNTLLISGSIFIRPLISQEDSKFKEILAKYLKGIIFTLIEIKSSIETNQKINMSEIAKASRDESIPFNQWYSNVKDTVNYVRNNYEFDLRTLRNDSISISETAKSQIRSFKNFYDLIKGKNRKGKTMTYLDFDYKTEIKIFYDGKCQGLTKKNSCDFLIDHKFLPCLGFHHLLENYNTNVKDLNYKYIAPKDLNCYSFNKSLKLMQTQVGGLMLCCSNCHSLKHSTRYTFPPIFNFLKFLSVEDVDKNTEIILKEAKQLANKCLEENQDKYNITRKNTKAKIKTEIYRGIIGFIKKKYVIEYLFGANFACPTCQKANINDHLVCFEAHHTDLDLLEKIEKIEFGREYSRKSIPWLINNIIKQNCVFICSNCHAMINATNYRDFSLSILENKNEANHIKEFYDEMDEKIRINRKKILDLENNTEIPDPLQNTFNYGEALDEKLVCIYYICEEFPKDSERGFFTARIFNIVLDKFHTHFNSYKDELLENGFIQYINGKKQYNQKIFRLTPTGIKKAKQIIKSKLNNNPGAFETLITQWNKRYKEFRQ